MRTTSLVLLASAATSAFGLSYTGVQAHERRAGVHAHGNVRRGQNASNVKRMARQVKRQGALLLAVDDQEAEVAVHAKVAASTTSEAAAVTPSPKAAVKAAPANEKYDTTLIYYDVTGWVGACGEYIKQLSTSFALPTSMYPDGAQLSDFCGKEVLITNKQTGESTKVIVTDASSRADYAVVPKQAFVALGGDALTGMLDVEFSFVDGTVAKSAAKVSSSVVASFSSASIAASKSSSVAAKSSSIAAAAAAKITTTTTTEAKKSTTTKSVAPTTTTTKTTSAAPTTTEAARSMSPSATTSQFDSKSAAAASSVAQAAKESAASQQQAVAASSSSAAAAASASQKAASDAAASAAADAEKKKQADQQAAQDAAAKAQADKHAAAKAAADQASAANAASDKAAADKAAADQAAADKAQQEKLNAKPTSNGNNGGGNSSGGGQTFTGGYATYYLQNGNPGNCGTVASDGDKVIALPTATYAGGSNCGKQIKLTRTDNGKSVVATVRDSCPTCVNNESLDLSVGAFTAIATESEGMVPISWQWA